MGNELDILYYNYMIESVIENRKIMELCTESKLANILLNESENKEELAIYEGKVIDSIITSIKGLFDKVINFLKTLWENITKKNIFKPKKKLIEACKQKIKSITEEERKNFYLEKIYIKDYADNSIKKCKELYENSDKFLQISIKFTNNYLNDHKYFESPLHNPPISDNEFDTVKNGIEELNKNLDDISNPENIKKEAININYGYISDILKDYESSETVTKKLNDDYKKISNEMKKHQKAMDSNVKNNNQSFIKVYNSEKLNKYRQLIYSITSYIIRLKKTELNLYNFIYKNEEAILRKFVTFSANVDTSNSANASSYTPNAIPLLASFIEDNEYENSVNEYFLEV